MWLDLKKCTFVIFVITMFSLLAVQPAFSLESDFVSTGNSTIGIPTAESNEVLLNLINKESLNSHKPPMEFKKGSDDKYGNERIYLHPEGSSDDNIADVNGNFDLILDIPCGKEFTFEVVVYRVLGIQTSYIDISVTVDGGTKTVRIDKETSASWNGTTSLFLVNKPNKTIGITRDRPTSDWTGWFEGDSKNHNISISGYHGLQLKFFVIFKK